MAWPNIEANVILEFIQLISVTTHLYLGKSHILWAIKRPNKSEEKVSTIFVTVFGFPNGISMTLDLRDFLVLFDASFWKLVTVSLRISIWQRNHPEEKNTTHRERQIYRLLTQSEWLVCTMHSILIACVSFEISNVFIFTRNPSSRPVYILDNMYF